MSDAFESLEAWHESRVDDHDPDDDWSPSLSPQYLTIDLGNGERYAIVARYAASARAGELAAEENGDVDDYVSLHRESMEDEAALAEFVREEMSLSEIQSVGVRLFDDESPDDRLANADVEMTRFPEEADDE